MFEHPKYLLHVLVWPSAGQIRVFHWVNYSLRAHSAAEPQPKKEKADLTTKDTKSTKFMRKNIGTLRGLRDLRGENISRHVLHP